MYEKILCVTNNFPGSKTNNINKGIKEEFNYICCLNNNKNTKDEKNITTCIYCYILN